MAWFNSRQTFTAVICVCVFQAYFLYRLDYYLVEIKTIAKGQGGSAVSKSDYLSGELKLPKEAQGIPNAPQQQNFSNTPGVVVLGMGRSGTSLLTGLCTKALQFVSPGRLKRARKKANAKGYFENVNVILQNEVWLQEQGAKMYKPNLRTSSSNSSVIVSGFSWQESCATDSCLETSGKSRNKTQYFYNRDLVLQHYNKPTKKPWIMKDPRLCLTLKLWLQVLDGPPPAAVIVFRNPLDNALSHKTRSDPGSLGYFLRLWIWFNRLAIENSRGLCRVVTRTEVLMQDPENEIQRIAKELERCGLPQMTVNARRVRSFFDEKLVHHSNGNKTATKTEENKAVKQFSPRRLKVRWKRIGYRTIEGNNTLQQLSPQGTIVRNNSLQRLSPQRVQDRWNRTGKHRIYNIAMKVYRDLESGEAFKEDYVWPVLT